MVPFTVKGALAPVFTPINEDQSINYKLIPVYMEYLAEDGVGGILVCGTTGEGPSLNVAERMKVAEVWMESAAPRKVRVIVQVGGAPLPDVKELAKHAENIHADAILTLPELYFKPKDAEQLVTYLEDISNAAPTLPILYYNFPVKSGVCLDPKEVFTLAATRVPNFKGMKGDLDMALRVVDELTGDKRVFIGNHNIATAALLGHESSIATITNIFPRLVNAILSAVGHGNLAETKELQMQLNNVVTAIASVGEWVPTMKLGMELVSGLALGPPRHPLLALNEHQKEKIRQNLIQNQVQLMK